MTLKRGKTKTKVKKSKSYFFKKSLNSFIIKLLMIIVSLSIFILVIYKAYNYSIKPIDLKNIPYIKNNRDCDKEEFDENDGLIFSNQDKKVYDTLKQKSKDSYKQKSKSEKITQDFSHKQIFDIVQEIKKDEAKDYENYKPVVNTKNKNISSKVNKKKISIKSIFDVLE